MRSDVVIPGPGGDIPARLYRPADAATGLVVYFHGGGWTIGSVEGSDGTARWFADTAGVVEVYMGDGYPGQVLGADPVVGQGLQKHGH